MFFVTNQGFGQKKDVELTSDYDIYNFVIDNMLGKDECQWGYDFQGNCIGAYFILNDQSDSTYFFYYKILENRNSFKYFVDSMDQQIITKLVDSIYLNRKNLAPLNIDSLNNERKCCSLKIKNSQLSNDSRIFISKIEKDENQQYAALYVNLDVGPLVGNGKIYFFKKYSGKWKLLTFLKIWVS